MKSAHEHPDRLVHKPEVFSEGRNSEKVKLELMSVVCIEKSHYVCFTRLEDRWVFFDSMADRTGMYVADRLDVRRDSLLCVAFTTT